MPLRIDKFSGEIPKIIGRLLPPNAAQIAMNTRLEDGSLLPFRSGALVHTFPGGGNYRTIYRHNGAWLGWTSYVSAVPGPIAADRLYVTGDGEPKMIAGGTTYPLRLQAPGGQPSISVAGILDPALSVTMVYCYTNVTSLDEESGPSLVTPEVLWSPGRTITIGNINHPAGSVARGVNRQRFYRSQTNSLGETVFYLIAERAASTADFVDNVTSTPIKEPLSTADHDPILAVVKGITAMPNGIMAGFDRKQLFFSEPYLPHAWPQKYVLTTDFDIVGLGVFGQSLAVLTKGPPYIVSGNTPDAMTMERVKVNLPCLNDRGIVDTGYAVIYPSPEGIVSISDRGAVLLTENLLNKEVWRKIAIDDIAAGYTNGRYIINYRFALNRVGMLIIGVDGGQDFLIRVTERPLAMWNEPGTNRLFLSQAGGKVIEWDSAESPYAEQIWRSKLNVLPGHANFGAILVEGVDTMTPSQRAANKARWSLSDFAATTPSAPPAWPAPANVEYPLLTEPPPPGFVAVVYADGRPIHVITDLNKPVRLPAGFLALSWEVEIRGTMQVTAISLAASPAELAMP